jgi:hypothetical protein
MATKKWRLNGKLPNRKQATKGVRLKMIRLRKRPK